MKKIKFSVLMLLLMYVLVACGVKADNTSENGGEGCNTADGIVDEETFDQLIKESENVELKEKVLEYIKNDEYHHVIDEVDKDGFTYKSVQISFYDNLITPYRELKERLLATDGIKEELEKELDNIIAASPHESSILARKMSAREMVGLYENMGKVMSFERNKDFTPLNEYKVTGLLKCDKSGNIVETVVFDGAVGSKVEIKDNNLWWEVCIVENVDFYYWGYNYGDKINYVDGIGKMSGSVYNMMVNDKHDITDIKYVRDTKNNTFENVYVKNYELTLSDFINNEELKKLITTNPADFKNQIRKMYGMEHEHGAHVKKSDFEGWYTQDAMYYFTTDGYLINITTVPRWTKMTMDEAYKIEFEEWEETVSELMFVGELNPEFGEVEIDKKKEGDITNVDTLVDKDEERELKKYLESIGYFIYDISIQYAMEYNGKKYISVQMDLWRDIDFPNYSSLWDYTAYEEKFEVRKVQLEDKDILDISEYENYNKYLDTHSLIKQKENIGNLITYEKGSGEYIAKNWAVTKMIIIDESDKVLKEIKHSGSITTGLGVRDGCVEWEIFSSDKVDYYAVKCEGEEMLSGHGYTSGGIYKIIFDKRDVVDKKEIIRESYDNDYDSLCIKEEYDNQYSENRKVYVKKCELTMRDFIVNEDVVTMASSWNLPTYSKALLGASHVYRNVYDGPQIYFTTDGYVVYVDTYVKYMKMSRDEFIEKYSAMDDESWKGEFKDMMYGLRVNDKLIVE